MKKINHGKIQNLEKENFHENKFDKSKENLNSEKEINQDKDIKNDINSCKYYKIYIKI
jgi:hypothetical protein